MPQLQKNPLSDVTVEDIKDTYRQGYIPAVRKNELLRQKAELTLEDIIQNQGILKTYFTQTLKHVQANWDDLVKMADDYKPAQQGSQQQNTVGGAANESLQTLRNAGRIMLAEIGMLGAPFQAFAEVNGTTVTRWALDAGAPKGLAGVLGAVIDAGSNFVPIGRLSQAFARGVQKNVPELVTAAKKITGAGKSAETTKGLAQAEKLGDEAIARGLLDDGVRPQGLEAFVDDVNTLVSPTRPPAPPDFYESLRKYHNEIKNVTETKHLAEIEKEADKLGIHLDDLKAMVGSDGKPMSPAQIRAYLNTLNEPTATLIENARALLRGDPDAGLRQDVLLRDYFTYTPTFRRAEVEAGRTVKVLDADPRMKSITNMMAAWDPESIGKLEINAARRTIAEDLVSLADDQEKLKRSQLLAMNETDKGSPNFWSKVKEGFSGGLLLRPVTWTRQFSGNTISAIVNTVEHELAGWLTIDAKQGAVKGEGIAAYFGQQAAIGEAFSAFGAAYSRNGAAQTRFDFPIHQIGGPFGRAINFGHDTIAGIDGFYKIIGKNSEIYASAYRDAVHHGLRPGSEEFADYVTRRRLVPTAANAEAAEDAATRLTFQQELGTWGQRAQRFLQAGPLYFYNPYMKSPINLIKWGWNHAPGLQFASRSLYEDILAGGPRADMAVARLTLSNMFGNFLFGLSQQGTTTGGGPTDPQLKRSWIATKQPYSVKGGDGNFYSFANTAEPGTTPIEMINDYAEIRNQLDDMTAEQTWTAIGLTVARNVLDNSWWVNMSKLVDMTAALKSGEEIGKKGAELLFSPVIAVGTGGPLGQSIERQFDPVRREARNWIDNLKNGPFPRVFGFGKDAPPLRDGYGDPILVPQAIGSSWLRQNMGIGGEFLAGLNNIANPFTSRPEETDPIKKEGARLQIKLPAFPWSTGGGAERDDFDLRTALPGEAVPVPLSAKQRDRWQQIYRGMIHHPDAGMAALMQTEEYKTAPWALQRELFHKQLAQLRENAKLSLMTEDVELSKKVVQSTAGRYLPMIQPDQRQGVQAQINDSLDLLDTLLPEQQQNLLKWGIVESEQESQKRDDRIIFRGEITKSFDELEAGARAQGLAPPTEPQ